MVIVSNWPCGRNDLVHASYRMPAVRALAIHPFGKRHIRAACACVALDALCGWLFGTVPCYILVSAPSHQMHVKRKYIPRSVILNVVLLNFLDVMVRLRIVHALCTNSGVSHTSYPIKVLELTISKQSLSADRAPAGPSP